MKRSMTYYSPAEMTSQRRPQHTRSWPCLQPAQFTMIPQLGLTEGENCAKGGNNGTNTANASTNSSNSTDTDETSSTMDESTTSGSQDDDSDVENGEECLYYDQLDDDDDNEAAEGRTDSGRRQPNEPATEKQFIRSLTEPRRTNPSVNTARLLVHARDIATSDVILRFQQEQQNMLQPFSFVIPVPVLSGSHADRAAGHVSGVDGEELCLAKAVAAWAPGSSRPPLKLSISSQGRRSSVASSGGISSSNYNHLSNLVNNSSKSSSSSSRSKRLIKVVQFATEHGMATSLDRILRLSDRPQSVSPCPSPSPGASVSAGTPVQG